MGDELCELCECRSDFTGKFYYGDSKIFQGGYVYIPSKPEKRKKWGENSGNRDYIRNRNEEIRRKYKIGCTVDNLAEEFFLSVDSIKKIIYTKGA